MPSVSIFHLSRPLRSSNEAQAVLAILRDHKKVTDCQPLVGRTELLPSAPDYAPAIERTSEYEWWQQTEDIAIIPGLWKKQVVFENYFKDLLPEPVRVNPTAQSLQDTFVGGLQTKVYAPSGIRINDVFRVVKQKDSVDGGWSIVEVSELSCPNIVLKWFSASKHKAAHEMMLDNIVLEANKIVHNAQAAGRY